MDLDKLFFPHSEVRKIQNALIKQVDDVITNRKKYEAVFTVPKYIKDKPLQFIGSKLRNLGIKSVRKSKGYEINTRLLQVLNDGVQAYTLFKFSIVNYKSVYG